MFSCACLECLPPHQHTLFRLPLRTPEQAETSELSNRSHSVAAIADLLQELQQEAVAMLLFLKRIEAISIYQWRESDEEPSVMFECSVRNMTPALRRQRELIALQNPEPDAWRQRKDAVVIVACLRLPLPTC